MIIDSKASAATARSSEPNGFAGRAGLKRLWNLETPRQAGMLFSAQSASLGAGLLVSVVQARWLGPGELGRFAFCLTVVLLTSALFEFGVFFAGARVLALTKDPEGVRRQLGAMVVLGLVVGITYSLFLVAVAAPLDALFKTDVRQLLMEAAALAFLQPFQPLTEQACQGLNNIRRLSLYQVLTSWPYLLIVIGLALGGRLTAESALMAYLLGTGLGAVWTVLSLRPAFSETKRYVRLTLAEVRKWGFNAYLARITGTAALRLDNLVIGYFLGRSTTGLAPLGLYTIAQKMGNAMITMSRAVAITRYRAFASMKRVPARINRWNAVVLVAAATALVFAGPTALRIAFPKYIDAAPLLTPFAIFALFAGLFQPYNTFLSSHGRGGDLRNIAAIVMTASLAGLIIAVPIFGIMGAAWVAAGVMAVDYLLHLHYYRQFTGSNTDASEVLVPLVETRE